MIGLRRRALYLWRLLLWKVRWYRWAWGYPGYRFGDPLLGRGDARTANRDLIRARYRLLEPRRPEAPGE